MSLHTPGRALSSERLPSSPVQDRAHDNKTNLIERLNKLMLSISEAPAISLDHNTFTAIHSEVDRIEVLVGRGERVKLIQTDEEVSQNPKIYNDIQGDPTNSPLAPTEIADARRLPATSAQQRVSRPQHSPAMSTSQVVEIASQAEELASQLATIVEDLQTRREESDHIHGLLITRAETAAQRIIDLESSITELKGDFEANESELR